MKVSTRSSRLAAAFLLFTIPAIPLLLLVCFLPAARSLEVLDGQAKPDIIFIVVDSLRPDHVSSYGYERETTPNLDSWVAGKGVIFVDATAASSWTNPSNGAMLTSRTASRIGADWTDANSRVPAQEKMLAEYLQDDGYFTAGFVSNWWLREEAGYGQGFDVYRSTSGAYRSRAGTLNEMAMEWLDGSLPSVRANDQPLFLFLYYLDPHSWYDAPTPFDVKFDGTYTGTLTAESFGHGEEVVAGNMILSERDVEHLIALYDGEVNYWDYELGRMLQHLDQANLLDNSIIVVTSDHGEMFGEHGKWVHGNSMYEEVLRIPLLFSYPGTIPAKLTLSAPVHMMDITPTLLDLVGLPVPPHMEGISLRPYMQGASEPPDRPIVSEMGGETDPAGLTYWIAPRSALYSVKRDGWKLIHAQQARSKDELYLLGEHSLYEEENLAATEVEKAGELFAEVQAYFDVPDQFLFLPAVQGE